MNDYFGVDYIGNAMLAKLKERIVDVSGRRWQNAFATTTLSELILYGVFADHVLGEVDANGHSR